MRQRRPVTIAKDKKAELQDLVQEWQKILKKEFKISDPDVKVVLDEAEKAETRFTAEGSAKIIDFMMSLDSGVIAMNMEVPGVAETSGNVGTIVTDNDTVTVRVCYRSGLNSKKEYTIEKSQTSRENGTCRICGRIQFLPSGSINQTAA